MIVFNRFLLIFTILLIIQMLFIQSLIAKKTVNIKIHSSIMNEDWLKLLDLLSKVDVSSSPIKRLIKAHTLLFLNQNNDSLNFFSSVSSNNDLEQWQNWVNDLLHKNPQKSISYYFAGDALMRLGQIENALNTFNQGLEIKTNHLLLLNARGVCFAIQKKWNNAMIDLYMATKCNSNFSDAYSNLGNLYLLRNEGASGAIDAFNKALKISPDFIIALNGRISANVVLGDLNNIEIDIKNIVKQKEKVSLIYDSINKNITTLLQRESLSILQNINKIKNNKPGMTIEQKTEYIKNLSSHEVAQLKGLNNDAIKFNRIISVFSPDEITNKKYYELSVGTNGPVPFAKIKVGESMDSKYNKLDRTVNNIRYQQETLNLLNSNFPNINPKSISRINVSFRQKHWNITHHNAGGVSTEEIGNAHIDKGNWNIITLFGLLYEIKPKSINNLTN